ncbi:MAG: flagellar protein [candidate division Zixibacteria bacterium]|nr:flagellar protein [candidate division Zixibacteria bacterium]
MQINPDHLILPLGKSKESLPEKQLSSKEGDFEKVLSSTLGDLKVSSHALDRLARRKINIKPEEVTLLNEAVSKAEGKGAKESLVLLNDLAFVVSVKNKTIITALQREGLRGGVFTNIDSTVIL